MSIFNNLRERLEKTRNNLVNRIKETLSGKANIDLDVIDKLEEILISADIGFSLTSRIIDGIRTELKKQKMRDDEKIIFEVLKAELKKIFHNGTLKSSKNLLINHSHSKPIVILIVGVNGVGKTTTIGKLAYQFKQEGKKVLIAASDTFRAAAKEQLEIWSERAKADILMNENSTDPSAVTYDSIEKAIKDDYDILLIDTAGRLHNKSYLMDELNKLNRIVEKKLNRAPDETLLIIDATSGQNAVIQAEEFSKVTQLTGLVVTKLDGSAKGGVVFQICEKQKIPVRYIGIGEGIDDLKVFNPDEFISALVDLT